MLMYAHVHMHVPLFTLLKYQRTQSGVSVVDPCLPEVKAAPRGVWSAVSQHASGPVASTGQRPSMKVDTEVQKTEFL